MEQSTTTVYAQGGRGNVRLLSWEGEKTLTFSFTDALLSPIGFSILSGAGLFRRGNSSETVKEGKTKKYDSQDFVHFHMVSNANLVVSNGSVQIDLTEALADFNNNAYICLDDAPIYIMEIESDGSLTGQILQGTISQVNNTLTIANAEWSDDTDEHEHKVQAATVMVDYYVDLPGQSVWEADITPETFGGNYYVEADTLFRTQDGKDLPANLTFPNVKIQSNFTMTFAGTGDPSTFDFTMDAFPGYTYFDKKKKVMAVLQIVDASIYTSSATGGSDPVMYHDAEDEYLPSADDESAKQDDYKDSRNVPPVIPEYDDPKRVVLPFEKEEDTPSGEE